MKATIFSASLLACAYIAYEYREEIDSMSNQDVCLTIIGAILFSSICSFVIKREEKKNLRKETIRQAKKLNSDFSKITEIHDKCHCIE